MSDTKISRVSLRLDILGPLLEQKLENEGAILDLMVAAVSKGQSQPALWEKLHDAALRDDRLAELAFAYERLIRDRRLRTLTPAAQVEVLTHAAEFFADVFGDPDGAEGYLERALALLPTDPGAFDRLESLLIERQKGLRLSELYASTAQHKPDRPEQLRLLKRAAEILDGFSGEEDRAIKLYQEILRLEPSDVGSRRSLEERYAHAGRNAELGRLLEQALAAEPPPSEEEATSIRERLLGLYGADPADVERALPHVEEVLRTDPGHVGARKVAEELLGHKVPAARVAALLESVYDRLGKPADAARMLAIQVEHLRGPRRLEAQKRLASLLFSRLGDLGRTHALDEAILSLDPADEEIRARYLNLSAVLDRRLDATKQLARIATGVKDPALRARMGVEVGDLHLELGDAKKARAAYQGVLETPGVDRRPAAPGESRRGDALGADEALLRAGRALVKLAAEARDFKALAATLGRVIDLEPDPETRIGTTERLARLCESELRDPAAAIGAWRRLLDTYLEPEALRALERLHEAAGAHAELCAVLERRAAAEPDAALARELAFRAADLRSGQLGDHAGGLEAWRRFVAVYGPSREAHARLLPLLEHERRWEELGVALAAEVALQSPPERAGALARLGHLRVTRLGDAAGALDAYRQALALDPADRSVRLAVDKMLGAGELRLAAADVLEPIARGERAVPVLVRILEVRAALAAGAPERLRALAEAADLAQRDLRDGKRAVELSTRGLAEAVEAAPEELPAWLDRIDRLCATPADASRRAAALTQAFGDRPVTHPAVAELAKRTGEALVATGDVGGALAVFRRALAFDPSSAELLARVDSLLREQGSPGERLALYRAALEQPAAPARRRELLHAVGAIERRDLGDYPAAVATYRRALDEDPADGIAYEALLELHHSAGAWTELYAELERALARRKEEDRPATLLRLAEVALARGWADKAAAHYRDLLAADVALGDESLGAVERLAREGKDLPLLRAVIERRVAMALEPGEEAIWLERLGEVEAEQGDLAGAVGAWKRAADRAEQAAEADRAERLYERVLAAAPADRLAAERLVRIYRAAAAWERMPRVVEVLLRGARSADERVRTLLAFEEPALAAGALEMFVAEADAVLAGEAPVAQRPAVRAARARVLSTSPARRDEAAAEYRRLIEEEGDAAPAVEAFEAFLATRGAEAAADRRWLFARRVERAAGDERVRALLAWAAAEERALGDPAAASRLHGRVLELEPGHDEALAAQARLLLALGDAAGAAEALARRRQRAAPGARAALDLELGTLLLDRLDRPEEALEAIAPVLEASPTDPGALRLVERALGHPSTRLRAARLLERAADATDDPGLAASLLDVLLSTPRDAAELVAARRGWFERLLDRSALGPERALEIALRAVGELPGDTALWARAERLAREAGRADLVAAAYRRELPALDPAAVEEIGRRAVDYLEEWFDEPDKVVGLLRGVVDRAPGAAWAFERLKLIYNLAERYDELFDLYDAILAKVTDPDVRAELLEDASQAAKDLASDAVRAIRYLEELHALRPDPRTRGALERLYERHGRHRQLIALLSGPLGALAGEPAQRLRARIASLWLDGVGDADAALEVIERMLDAEPGRTETFDLLERVMRTVGERPAEEGARPARQRAIARLKERYRADGRSADLVRVLEVELHAASSPAERAERLREIARLRLDKLGDDAGAFETLAALALLEPEAEEHRAELGALARRLGQPGRHAEALAAVAAGSAPALAVRLLAEAAAIHRSQGQRARAIELDRAVLARAGDDLAAALAAARELDTLLAEEGRAAERCDLLAELARMEPEPGARRAARRELARLALGEGGDRARATGAYRAQLAEDPRDVEALDGLARALEEDGQWRELFEVLGQRAAAQEGAGARASRVLAARVLDERLDEPDKAIEAWQALRADLGPDAESADALSALFEKTGRFAGLVAHLEREATEATDGDRAADLFRRLGDAHRTHTLDFSEAVASYELALEPRPGHPGARAGLEALVTELVSEPREAARDHRAALVVAVKALVRTYADAGDWAATAALLEPRLAAADDDGERSAILTETARLLERTARDFPRAFDALWRAFSLAPAAEATADVVRLADLAQRWEAVAAALAGPFGEQALPAAVARPLFWGVALWARDRKKDPDAAEAALGRALAEGPPGGRERAEAPGRGAAGEAGEGAIEPSTEAILEALAEVQRRAPGRALIATLLRLSDLRGGDLAAQREAALVALDPVGDRALAKTIAQKLLDGASARWAEAPAAPAPAPAPAVDEEAAEWGEVETPRADPFASPAQAAAWALDLLVRLSNDEGPERVIDLYLRGARLPFDAGERRRLRLRAAELADTDATMGIYRELFDEDPTDALSSARLEALYRAHGRRAELLAMRERQLAVTAEPALRLGLRHELALLLAEGGEHAQAIAALKENLAYPGGHAPSVGKLVDLLEAGGHHRELVGLLEEQAAAAEPGDRRAAAALWGRAGTLAEARLADPRRAIAAHRRAAALGAVDSADAIVRLLTARGDHAAAAEMLETIWEQSSPDNAHLAALRLAEAHLAAGQPERARETLERALGVASDTSIIRLRLAGLYRETKEWGRLAELVAGDAARAADRPTRVALLREAADLHLLRRGDAAAAIPLLEQAAALSSEELPVRLHLAAALAAGGRLDEAASMLRELVASYGDRRPKDRALVHYQLARVSLAAGDRARAFTELDAALRIDPAHPDILYALARLALEQGQLDRANRTFRALLMVVKASGDPRRRAGEAGARAPTLGAPPVSRAEVLFELGEIARRQDDPARASEYLDSAFEASRESPEERERLLTALRERGSHDVLARALESRLATLADDLETAALLSELAALYEQHLGRPADALDARLRSLTLAPSSAAAREAALAVAVRTAQVERYVAVLARLVDDAREPARALELTLSLGRALESSAHDDARAAEAYRRAERLLEERPADARLREVWLALEGIYLRLGDTEARAELLGKRAGAAAGAPPAERADPLYQLAVLRLGKRETQGEGAALLERALAADPQLDRAEAALREAVPVAPESDALLAAFERFAREHARDRALVDVLLWRADLGTVGPEGLREAVDLAMSAGDLPLAASILRRVIGRAAVPGAGERSSSPDLAFLPEAAIVWALVALARLREAEGDLAEAAGLEERAARAAGPEEERALLLHVAGLAAGPLADLDRAARLYEELLAREPAEREIWQPLADVYRRKGDGARLAALLEATVPLVDSTAERGRMRLERARLIMAQDEPRATALLQEILEEDPSQLESAILLSGMLERAGRREELAALLARQLEAAKDRGDVASIVSLSLRLGGLLEQQWDEQGALDVYHAALDWDGESRDVLRAIVRLSASREDSMDLTGALDKLLVVETGPEAEELALRLARIRGAQGDARGAEAALEQGYAACPTSAPLRDELAQGYAASGSFRKLADLHVLDASTRADKGEQVACLERAAALLRERAGDPAGAAALLERALEVAPTSQPLLAALIDAAGAIGAPGRAVEALGRALAHTPGAAPFPAEEPGPIGPRTQRAGASAEAWIRRARAALQEALGHGDLALADLERAHALGGGSAGELIAQLERSIGRCVGGRSTDGRTERELRLRLAEVLVHAGELDKARPHLTELARRDVKDREALRALAGLEDAAGRWDAASAVLRRLLPLEDGEALVATAIRLADACERGDRLADARGGLERAIRVAPGHPAIRLRLRRVYNVTGASRELAGLLLEDAAAATDLPARHQLLMNAARLLLDSEGDAGKAAAVLEDARRLRPEEAEATLLLSDAYVAAGRRPDARAALTEAAAAHKGRRSKQLSAIYRRLARIDHADGDAPAALASLVRAFENDPHNGPLAMEVGLLAVAGGDEEVASRAFRAVTLMKLAAGNVAEGTTTVARALAYYHLANMARAQGDKRKARLMVEKAVSEDPSLEPARALLDELRAGG